MSEEQVTSKSEEEGSRGSPTASQTAQEYIAQQLQLEADAKEALPYQFDTCTKPLGPLRQSLFSCLTCSPPPSSADTPYTAAGICYSCSISCHGEHELVELFSKRDFECDCGTTRLPSLAPCSLRSHPTTGAKGGVSNEDARSANTYNQNFKGRFCACGEVYDPAKEKGTMFQCLGLDSIDSGGCGEDWWHPECLLGLPRHSGDSSTTMKRGDEAHNARTEAEPSSPIVGSDTTNVPGVEPALPAGFPAEDAFCHLLCYKCVEAQPWIKPYAGTSGFLDAVPLKIPTNGHMTSSTKRKLDDTGPDTDTPDGTDAKRPKTELSDDRPSSSHHNTKTTTELASDAATLPKHARLEAVQARQFSVFMKDDFRDNFCRCQECFPRLASFPQLMEEEEAYEPPVSESDEGDAAAGGSVGSRSLLDRGEAALSTMDRMRAIEGVMAYNHLKDKVKAFLQPFADSGQTVGAEDVKAYFARLRGDEDAMRQAAVASSGNGAGDGSDGNRREQSGY